MLDRSSTNVCKYVGLMMTEFMHIFISTLEFYLFITNKES